MGEDWIRLILRGQNQVMDKKKGPVEAWYINLAHFVTLQT